MTEEHEIVKFNLSGLPVELHLPKARPDRTMSVQCAAHALVCDLKDKILLAATEGCDPGVLLAFVWLLQRSLVVWSAGMDRLKANGKADQINGAACLRWYMDRVTALEKTLAEIQAGPQESRLS